MYLFSIIKCDCLPVYILFKRKQSENIEIKPLRANFRFAEISLMRFIADIHLHSWHSRATSKDLNLETLYQWARIKGINVVGTGDFTHPQWIKELEEKLEPEGNGLFRLKNPPLEPGLPNIKTRDIEVRFCLSTEISSIYKYGEKVRKTHNIIVVPDFETARRINARLGAIGNLASDGRPILGLPSRDLMEIVLESSADTHLIPAHIWTPWFSALGSNGGYDSIEECFRDLSGHIFALETGLSSDPAMNWKLSSLDRYALVSNSDAHSPQKLGREANIFDTEFSYYAMFEALKTKNGFSGTYEFFPEEGKYHLDGHRKCNVVLEPHESLALNNLCPRCGKPLTIGVLHRVEKLADRKNAEKPKDSPGYKYIIPLPEIIAEFMGTAPAANAVQKAYTQIISVFGNEFELLHTVPVDEIRSKWGELLAEAIRRLREQEVKPQAGYDGEFGVIKIFNPGEISNMLGQKNIFGDALIEKMVHRNTRKQHTQYVSHPDDNKKPVMQPNEEQKLAVEHEGNVVVNAGPGTGKTNTLVQWIIHQIEKKDTKPREIIAITFTNKAADELRARLEKQVGAKASEILIGTFHALAYRFLKEINPEIMTIYDEGNRISLFRLLFPGLSRTKIHELSNAYEAYHEENRIPLLSEYQAYFDTYHKYLADNHAVDLSGIVWQVNLLLKSRNLTITQRYKCLAIDEFQDINPVQYEFVRLIAGNKRIFTIGDPNQCIYGFRGSDIRLFFRAKEDFNATEISLLKNYRTPKNILNAANILISHNQQRAPVNTDAVKSSAQAVKYFVADDARQEAEYIAEQILNYVGGVDAVSTGQLLSDYNYAFSDIAVLYRTHQVADAISRELKLKGIPVLLSDGTSFFSQPPFDLIANALKLLQNKKDVIALSGLAERFLGPDEHEIQILVNKYVTSDNDFENFVPHPQWKRWISIFNELNSEINKSGLQHTLQQLLDFFLPVSVLTDQQQMKREILLKLAAECTENSWVFFQKYILSPYTDAGRLNSGGVRLLTFHAAKGLEFPVVFIAGAEEGITPSGKKDADIDEERRLFYVAMTRAKDELQIIRSKKRKLYGMEKEMLPSRFLSEIDQQYFEHVEFSSAHRAKPVGQQLKLF